MLTIKSIAYHRNGVCGEPFHVVLFRDSGLKGRRMVAVLFDDVDPPYSSDGRCRCAVLDADMAAAGNVTFGENSWRGDDFDTDLRRAINEWHAKRAAAAVANNEAA